MSERAEAVSDGGMELPPVSRQELAAQVAELEGTVQALTNLVSMLGARSLQTADDLRAELNRRVSLADLAGLHKDMERIRQRMDDVIEEVGYGEALDIAKIPPEILEAAYQAILDDVVSHLREARGGHDAETHIVDSIEQVRLKTSGSDLFHYRPQVRGIQVGVAKSLDRGLVSARQVHMTFEELLRHLLEPIQDYPPKNVRALIKVKSQEYAVGKALTLAKEVGRIGPPVRELEVRVRRLEEQLAGALKDVKDFVGHMQERLTATGTQESVEALSMRLARLEARVAEPPPRPKAEPAKGEEPPPPAKPAAPSPLDDRILATLSREPRSFASIRKELDVEEHTLRAALESLVTRNRLSASARGKSTVYRSKEANDDA